MSKICLIDGSGFIFRAFHALPPLNTKDGTPVNAVYGFAKSIMALQEDRNIEYIAVIFDASRITFRQDIYKEYKAQRPPAPEDLIPQFALIREATKALNIVSIEMDGFEADDLIATYTKMASQKGIEVEIVSSDKDLMQLVDDSKNIYMYDALKKKIITEKEVYEKFSVLPSKVIEVQALMGDSADNVPGIKGVGPKSAADLINQFGDISKIYENIELITKKALKENLLRDKDMAFISKQLVTLKNNIDVPLTIEDLEAKEPDPKKLCDFFQKLSFSSLAAKVASKYNIKLSYNLDSYAEQSVNNVNNEVLPAKTSITKNIKIESLKNFKEIINNLAENRKIPIIINYEQNQIKNISIYSQNNDTNYFINLKNIDLLSDSSVISQQDFFENIAHILEDESILKISYDIKKLMHLASYYNISVRSYDDIEQMSYLITGVNNQENKLSYLLKNTLFIEEYNKDQDIPPSLLINLHNLYCSELIKHKQKYLYEVFDKPILQVLFAMEKSGIQLEINQLKNLSAEFEASLKEIEKNIFAIAKVEFNVGSPKQLGEILFEKMEIKGKKNKSGSWKTEAGTLESLAEEGIELAALVLKWRQLSKLKNTYTDKLPEKIDPKTNRIHTTYLPCSTTTARLSSVEPNLQNIPIRTNEGKNIRKAFVSKNGYKIISLDYSQIELRILASMGNISSLKVAFEKGEDIHKTTASEMFGVAINEVDSNLRRQAKAINFGIIYGQTAYGLANSLGISREVAKQYIESYFQKYPEIKAYMEETVTFAKKYGFVNTYFNRKCFVDGINSSNANMRNFAERAAINARIQGTGADVMRKALIDVYKYLVKNNIDANILLQIHDEMIIEAKEDIADSLAKAIQNIMENCCNINISLNVDYGIANNWFEA